MFPDYREKLIFIKNIWSINTKATVEYRRENKQLEQI
jgi:hypothetical protein